MPSFTLTLNKKTTRTDLRLWERNSNDNKKSCERYSTSQTSARFELAVAHLLIFSFVTQLRLVEPWRFDKPLRQTLTQGVTTENALDKLSYNEALMSSKGHHTHSSLSASPVGRKHARTKLQQTEGKKFGTATRYLEDDVTMLVRGMPSRSLKWQTAQPLSVPKLNYTNVKFPRAPYLQRMYIGASRKASSLLSPRCCGIN